MPRSRPSAMSSIGRDRRPPAPTDTSLRRSLFVIPSIEGADLLRVMLPTLGIPPDIVVVLDQGSGDDTAAVCARAGVAVEQLGSPRTYTECCNIGIALARSRGSEFLFIANNDIRFVTDVCRELLAEMGRDPAVAICAPSQLIVDTERDLRRLAYRAAWNLETVEFLHDFEPPDDGVERLEADFCELTCAAIRMSALETIGAFDDGYGFYHEDADLGFRARAAGYLSCYLPQSQIQHFTGSTVAREPADFRTSYIRNSRNLFARKHLGYAVKHADHGSRANDSWTVINRHLHGSLRRHGLVDPNRPELIFSHVGTEPFDYIYTVWETDRVPAAWEETIGRYRSVLVTSRWNQEVIGRHLPGGAHYVPLGVDTDVFHPWGPAARWGEEVTFLWFGRVQHRKGLDVLLAAWRTLLARHPKARLVIMGVGVPAFLGLNRGELRQWRKFLVHDDPETRISCREIVEPLTEGETAAIYRGSDVVVCSSRSEGFGLTVVEAMACGTRVIFPDYGGCADFVHPGALTFGGTPARADYADKGFADVGNWWDPDARALAGLMEQAHQSVLSGDTGATASGLQLVRSRFTWRATCFGLREVLSRDQERRDFLAVPSGRPSGSRPTVAAFARSCETAGAQRNRVRSALPRRETEALAGFDPEHYAMNHPDVARRETDLLKHFAEHGWAEGREPSGLFDTRALLAANPAARRTLLARHLGGRSAAVDLAESCEARSPRGAERSGRLRLNRREAEALAGFDPDFYRDAYPDVVSGGGDLLTHYVEYGWSEDRTPSRLFNTHQLIAANPVARRVLLARGRAEEVVALRKTGWAQGLKAVLAGVTAGKPAGPMTRGGLSRPRRGLLFTGYFEAGLGLGESARGLAGALAFAGIRFALNPYNHLVQDRYIGPFMEDRYDLAGRYGLHLIEVALDQLPGALSRLGPARTGGGYIILRPYWELERIPPDWTGHLEAVDEVWAPTAFIAETFRKDFAGPITVVPPVVDVGVSAPRSRDSFGLREGTFYFIFSFDYTSGPARKNPLGTVRAFREAFRPGGGEDVGLVIKSNGHPDLSPRVRSELKALGEEDDRIRIVDGTLDRDGMVSLLACCDCYVSLHRSEGFGLGLAEMMALGKPAVGTDYSGNRDFLTAERGYPVPFRMRPIRDGEYPHAGGQSWAEPDPEAAASAFRAVFDDPGERARRAQAGRDFVARAFGRPHVGRLAGDRLAAIAVERRRRGTPSTG